MAFHGVAIFFFYKIDSLKKFGSNGHDIFTEGRIRANVSGEG
ncbi:hypothetical protein B4064_2731 [Caldibacillus thermoamylovorans]|jgi:hypothetical protein|uniref:Uncharacterized protein n=1 Tax=Caldibacillus thermoamylovorans TaxID=35841 RepID=A0A0D0FL81_9BACI|nr:MULTISPECIES: hypothetical protein [Bacillaceae]KIO62608.1 hypothetical protein B4065_3122 [Caldibacillus thermoamylovorans]KIO62694.1 hypothetical protein B4166_3128 [Caldibacillus thermoamylovorans]KIO64625.1 hypothetical protein B4064_2731 [Caldibacillus thermoamylovorans]KIO71670.1 hypothetical protein B4167_3514 [Caldibacillus thermoamylovorans]